MCQLKKDKKTYEYIKMFMSCTNEIMIFRIEQEIQAAEIRIHLMTHNIDEGNQNEESLLWIDKNAKGFRDYIETMKHIIKEYEIKDHNDFCYVVDLINGDVN